jgi:hypothetical protein
VQPKSGVPFELYDLQTDPGEAHDVIASHLEVAASLTAWMRRAHTESYAWPTAARR